MPRERPDGIVRSATAADRDMWALPAAACRMGANKEAVGRIREVTNQDAIKIRSLMDAGCGRNHVTIERRSLRCHHLGRYTRRDPPNHLDRHKGSNSFARP